MIYSIILPDGENPDKAAQPQAFNTTGQSSLASTPLPLRNKNKS